MKGYRIGIGVSLLYILLTTCENSARGPSDMLRTESNDRSQPEPVHLMNDSTKSGLLFKPGLNYDLTRTTIENERIRLNTHLFSDSVLALASQQFTDRLLNHLIPYWYGTPWDFNGHTDEPNVGRIACGYFVSTTLKHMGLELNRYRMAQQSSLSMAKTIAMRESQVTIRRPEDPANPDYDFLFELPDGLYIVGLAYHVGYLYRKDSSVYFIHSDYLSGNVQFENALKSPTFLSDIYCMAPITGNKALMKKWLRKEDLIVVMD